MADVRRVVLSDFEVVHSLLDQLMPASSNLRRDIWRPMLARRDYAAWIAEVGGRPAGFIDVYVLPDIGHGRDIGLINNLVVDERFRRRGLGQELLKAAAAHCRALDAVELHVWTETDNAGAIALYERSGYVRRAVLMELQL